MTFTDSVRVVNLGVVPFMDSQSLYHAVAYEMDEHTPDTILLCSPREPYVCIGHHQKQTAVVDPVACERLGLPVIQRRLGGGTTYLDSDQIFYQCIFHRSRVPSIPARIYELLLSPPVSALNALGLFACLRDSNELEVNCRRIAGTGGGRIRDACVVVGNVLLDFNYEAMPEIMRAPCDPFRQVAGEAMRDRITTLRKEGIDCTNAQVGRLIVDQYLKQLNRKKIDTGLTDTEWKRAESLERKLVLQSEQSSISDGSPPQCSIKISRTTSVHFVGIKDSQRYSSAVLRVKNGLIESSLLLSTSEIDASVAYDRMSLRELTVHEAQIGETVSASSSRAEQEFAIGNNS